MCRLISVFIVGGGPVDLSMSILPAHHGVRSLLLEQHPDIFIFLKARFVKARFTDKGRTVAVADVLKQLRTPRLCGE